jgi:4-hydroxy-3-methylbut-2-enyl diphosphate reductase
MKWCTTSSSATTCAPRAPSSSTSSPRYPPAASSSSAPTASPKRDQRGRTARGLKVFDATCPLVTKVHVEVARMRKDGREIVMIGHKGHPEVEGTMGQSADGMYLVETVADARQLRSSGPCPPGLRHADHLSVDDAAQVVAALKERFPESSARRRTTSATRRRTARMRSSNWPGQRSRARRRQPVELQLEPAARSRRTDRQPRLPRRSGRADRPGLARGASRVGVTAGASAPEVLVQNVVDRLSGGDPARSANSTAPRKT